MNSPTGRNPRLNWTPAQQDVYDRIYRENHLSAQVILGNAQIDRYGSFGRWKMLAYQLTGDRTYAQAAFAEFKKIYTNFDAVGLTALTQYAAFHGSSQIMLADWIWPGLDTPQQDELKGALLTMVNRLQGNVNRLGDSDLIIGHYFTTAMADLVFGTDYLTRDILNTDTGKRVPWGGFVATGANMDSVRNRIDQFCAMAEGGLWPESTEYNPGTGQELNYAYAVETALGVDYFPKVTRWRAQAMRQQMHEITPGFLDSFQVGDEENPHDIRLGVDRGDWWNALAFLPCGDAALQEGFRSFITEAKAALKFRELVGAFPIYARHYLFANPYAPTRDWRTVTAPSLVALGQGSIYWRDGQGADAKAFHAQFQNFAGGTVDHFQTLWHGDFRLFGFGRFVLDRPNGYGSDPTTPNAVLVGIKTGPGFEASGITASAFLAGRFGYVVGTNAGLNPYYFDGNFINVPTFNDENTRHLFQPLAWPDPVALVIDRVQATDPKTILLETPWGTRPYPDYWGGPHSEVTGRIEAMLGPKDVIFHTPTPPAFSGDDVFTWPIGDGITGRIAHLTGTVSPMVHTVIDELNRLPGVSAGEAKFQTHSVPATHRAFDVFVHLVSASQGAHPTGRYFRETAGEPLVGVELTHPTAGRLTVLASGKPGPRLETSYQADGATIRLDRSKLATVTAARMFGAGFRTPVGAGPLYLLDCPATLAWTLTLDGVPLQIVREGVMLLASAPHDGELTLAAAGVVIPDPVPVPVPDPQPEGDDLMADVKTIEGLIVEMNVATNRIADRLNAQVAQIETLKAQIAEGDSVTVPQLDAVVASLTAERDRLKALGADAVNPIPGSGG